MKFHLYLSLIKELKTKKKQPNNPTPPPPQKKKKKKKKKKYIYIYIYIYISPWPREQIFFLTVLLLHIPLSKYHGKAALVLSVNT